METVKHRTLIVPLSSPEDRTSLETALRNLRGIRSVDINRETGRLQIAYDLGIIHLGVILRTLEDTGFPAKTGLLGKMRLNLASFMEENEQGNLTAPPPPCCSDPKHPPSEKNE